jgi:hypothetical protein
MREHYLNGQGGTEDWDEPAPINWPEYINEQFPKLIGMEKQINKLIQKLINWWVDRNRTK